MNKTRLHQFMKSEDLDVIVSMSPENVYYLSGTYIHSQTTIRDRLAIVVWPLEEHPSFLVCILEEAQANEDSWIEDVRPYFEFKTSPIELLAKVLRERGYANHRIGIEFSYLSSKYFLELRDLLPELNLVDCSSLLERVRMIKTSNEIEQLRDAAQVTDRVIRKVFENIVEGKEEKEIANELQTGILEAGADENAFLSLASASNSCLTHPVPSSYKVKHGDLIRTDFGGYFNGYLSDIARLCVVGKLSERQLDIYNWLWDVHEQLISKMVVGAEVSDIYNLCKQLYEEAGMPFERPHIGHGLGLTVHEHPMINPYVDQRLEPNMVICIEPNHLVPNTEKYHVEDTILIQKSGPEILSRTEDWSNLLVVG